MGLDGWGSGEDHRTGHVGGAGASISIETVSARPPGGTLGADEVAGVAPRGPQTGAQIAGRIGRIDPFRTDHNPTTPVETGWAKALRDLTGCGSLTEADA